MFGCECTFSDCLRAIFGDLLFVEITNVSSNLSVLGPEDISLSCVTGFLHLGDLFSLRSASTAAFFIFFNAFARGEVSRYLDS